jgi:2-polyprenyl-6-methoxyphenol hydroxylase-like FAD-dependent oxidoreductase
MSDDRVIVAGAGLAGLVAATALRHAGFPTTVLERTPVMGPVGAIIGITHAAATELENMGQADLVKSACIPVQGISYFTWKGKPLTRMPIAEAARQAGTRTFITMRADIQLGLYEKLEPGVVQLGSEVAGFSEDDGRVSAKLADGREEPGAALLGADGIHSAVRRQLRGDQPRYTGYMAWRGVATLGEGKVPIAEGEAHQLMGRGRTCGAFGLSKGRMYWFVTSLQAPGGKDSPAGRKADVFEAFKGGPDHIRNAIEVTPEEDILRNDVFDRPKVGSWGRGRVTIMGDAAHATSPATGEGGSHAVLDAAGATNALLSVRARLDDTAAVEAALKQYEAEAIERTGAGVKRAADMGDRLHAKNPVQALIRNIVFKRTSEETWLERAKFYLS